MIATWTTRTTRGKRLTSSSALQGVRASDDSFPTMTDCVHHPSFSLPVTEEHLWGPGRREIHVPEYGLLPAVDDEPPQDSVAPWRLTAEEERTLFLRYNYAKYRLRKLLDLRDRGGSAPRAEAAALWRQRVLSVRVTLLHANLPLVPAMAKRMRNSGVEFGEMISEGYIAVMRCIEKFDVSRGFKFSTYACRALLAQFCRMMYNAKRFRDRFPVEFDPDMERSDQLARRHEQQRSDAIHAVREVLTRNKAGLTEEELTVVQERFLSHPPSDRPTLAQLGATLGVSSERIRQLETRSLLKVRAALEGHAAARFGPAQLTPCCGT